jgi:hypothetical protein
MIITQEENELLIRLVSDNQMVKFDPRVHVTAHSLAKALDVNVKKAHSILEERYSAGELDRVKLKTPGTRWQWGYFSKSKTDQ